MVIAKEFSGRRKAERSNSRTFIRRRMYIKGQQSAVRIQSTLCEVAGKQDSRVYKIAIVKAQRIVV